VGELLAACTSLKILITSREVLHLAAEHIFTVSALAVPDLDLRSQLSTEQLSQYDGIQLFVERARAAKPNVSITSQNVPVIAEICIRLDGLPLGYRAGRGTGEPDATGGAAGAIESDL